MDEETSDILGIENMDKREVNLKSPNMEPEALRRILDKLSDLGLTVKETVTDGHRQIPPILGELHFYPWPFQSTKFE